MLDLAEVRRLLDLAEAELVEHPIAKLTEVQVGTRPLGLFVTARLRRQCRKGRVWKSPGMLTALKNAGYGLDLARPRSRGGSDGIYLLDRGVRPPNAMMRKLFDRFLDKPDPLVAQLEERFGVPSTDWLPVRVVSHHLRLLGIFIRRASEESLVLVDYDHS